MSEPVCFATDPQPYIFAAGFLCGLMAAGLVASFVMLKKAGRAAALALLAATAAHAQPVSHLPVPVPAPTQAQPADEAPAPPPPPPATLGDWMRGHVAAVAWIPVLTSGRDKPAAAADGEAAKPSDEPTSGVGIALRITPDRWLPWAAGPFADLKLEHAGPWFGRVLFRGAGGSAGIGIGYQWSIKGGLDLTEDGYPVVGMTASIASFRAALTGARGGAQ